MSFSDKSTPLLIHTLETLCKELISGRSILLDDQGNEFKLTSKETCSLFNWYFQNTNKWDKPNKKEDVENLVNRIDEDPPKFPFTKTADKEQPKGKVHLKKMKVPRAPCRSLSDM